MAHPPTASNRVVISGALPGGEVFAIGFWFNTASAVTSQADADAISASLKTLWSGSSVGAALLPLMATGTTMNSLVLYCYGPSGLAVKSFQSLSMAGSGTVSHPNQVALVASLRTLTLTARGRGRVYLPANGIFLTGGQLTPAQCSSFAGALANWLHGINIDTSAGQAKQAVVYSVADGNTKAITSVIIDSRPDIQRRRANKETVIAVATAGV